MVKYPDFLMDHFQNPRNTGEISDPDAIGTVGNALCGDIMHLSIKVTGNKITEVKFLIFGCGTAIAAGSILTERIKGITLDEALKISDNTSEDILSQLPKEKVPCFTLATEALKLAIEEYRCREEGIQWRGSFDERNITGNT